MHRRSWIAALAAFLLCTGTADAVPPLETYGRLPTLSDMTLSPDGSMVAYVRGNDASRLLVIQTVGAQQQKPTVLNIGDQKLRGLQWADNTHLLIVASTTTLPVGLRGPREEWYTVEVFDLEKKSQHGLVGQIYSPGSQDPTGHVEAMNTVAGFPQPRVIDGHTFVFVPGIFFPNNKGRLALIRVELGNSDGRVVSQLAETHAHDWLVDEAGRITAEADYYEDDQHWKLKVFRNGDIEKPIDISAPIDAPDIEGLSEDATSILIRLPQTQDWPSYQRISLTDGSSEIWQRSDLHLDDLLVDEYSGRVIGGPRATEKSDYVFFDPHADVVWRSIKAAFSDATNVALVSWSEDRNKVVVHVFGPNYGDGYFFVDMTTHKADPIGNEYDDIDDVSPEKWIDYRAADGRVIHAYLTVPVNRDAKNLPLIVLPHGGPHARDFPGFDWIAQALASRGYAILQPEFRGSEGFGEDLLSAGFGEFGRKMQTDLSDGVRALTAQGIVDPKRVCIVGASYGGYAALAGATLQTGVYRCAVSIAGLSDLHKLLGYLHWPRNTWDDRSERFWDRFLGVTDPDDPKLDAISPIKHVDRVTIPILLIHGKDDTVVPISQSEDMADALKAAGKQVEFVQLDGEDHWMSKSETRLQMLQATVKFLEANNPPDAVQAPAANTSASK